MFFAPFVKDRKEDIVIIPFACCPSPVKEIKHDAIGINSMVILLQGPIYVAYPSVDHGFPFRTGSNICIYVFIILRGIIHKMAFI